MSDSDVVVIAQTAVNICQPLVVRDQKWGSEAVRALVNGTESVLTKIRRPPESKAVLERCERFYEVWGSSGQSHDDELSRVQAQASVMVIEDAQYAIAAYIATEGFVSNDEAYLKKYGLLQAFQLQFDAVGDLARAMGMRLKIDDKRAVLVFTTRQMVAGHPVGSTVQQRKWHHFHDRASASDPTVIKVMAFESSDSTRWTGWTMSTAELVLRTSDIVCRALDKIIDHVRSSPDTPDSG